MKQVKVYGKRGERVGQIEYEDSEQGCWISRNGHGTPYIVTHYTQRPTGDEITARVETLSAGIAATAALYGR